MTSKTVTQCVPSVETDEGDGAIVRRSIGRPEVGTWFRLIWLEL